MVRTLRNALLYNKGGPRLSVHRSPQGLENIGRQDPGEGGKLYGTGANVPIPATSVQAANGSTTGFPGCLEIDGASNRGIDEVRI